MVALRNRQRLLQPVHQQNAIRQIRQGIEMRHAAYLFFHVTPRRNVDESAYSSIDFSAGIPERRGITDQMPYRAIIENDVLLEVSHFNTAEGRHLYREFMWFQRAAIAEYAERWGLIAIGELAGQIAALRQAKQIVGHAIAGNRLAFSVVRD